MEKDQVQRKLQCFELEIWNWLMAKVNIHKIVIGKGNGTFSPKPKSRKLKIDHLDRGGFTDSNVNEKNRIEKDQIQQKLQSFGLERSK